MNLIDAIKSGRPFRRNMEPKTRWRTKEHLEGEQRWLPSLGGGTVAACLIDVSIEDLLADDWEVKQPAVTITRNQFWTAVHGSSSSPLGQELCLDFAGIERLARRLGLEPAA